MAGASAAIAAASVLAAQGTVPSVASSAQKLPESQIRIKLITVYHVPYVMVTAAARHVK
jgi:hypothetical protein